MSYREAMRSTLNTDLTHKERLLNAALGLCGESGELADLIKKHFFQGHALDRDLAIKELGDVRWYLELMIDCLDTTLEEVEARNVAKLKARFPNGFSSAKSLNRTV